MTPTEPSVATRLAERICAFRLEDLTARALSEARTAIIDTVGCTLAGSVEPCVRILLDTPGVADAPGPALVFGTDRRTSALDATLVNGTASHALDYDDVSGVMGGHHSVPVTAPIFALGQQLGSSGRCALAAYVIGVETEVRLSRRRQLPPLRQGMASDGHAGHVRSRGCGVPSAGPRRRAHGPGSGVGRVVLERDQGELRDDDQALARGPRRAQRPVGCAAGRAGLRVESRGARAPPGLVRGLQRCGPIPAGAPLRAVGRAVGDRVRRQRSQAVPVLRLDPSRHRHDAGSRAGGGRDRRRGGAHRDPGPPPPPAPHRQPRPEDVAPGQVLDPVRDRPGAGRRRRAPGATSRTRR